MKRKRTTMASELAHVAQRVAERHKAATSPPAPAEGEIRVVVDGHRFVLFREEGQWSVFWEGEPPPGYHPELGKLAWVAVPGATPTTGLAMADVDQVDRERKEELLSRVAVAAGLTLRPLRYGKPEANA